MLRRKKKRIKNKSIFENDLIRETYSRNNMSIGLIGLIISMIIASLIPTLIINSSGIKPFVVMLITLILFINVLMIIGKVRGGWKYIVLISSLGAMFNSGLIIGIGLGLTTIIIFFPILYIFWSRN